MDRRPLPEGDRNEVRQTDPVVFTGFKITEATDCFGQFGQARQLTGRSDLVEVESAGSVRPRLAGGERNVAMIEALHNGMVIDHAGQQDLDA